MQYLIVTKRFSYPFYNLVFRVSQWGSQDKNDPSLYTQHRLFVVMRLAEGWQSLSYWIWSWNVGLLAATLLCLLSILLPSLVVSVCRAHGAVGCRCSPAQFAFLHRFPWPRGYQSLARPTDVIGGPSFHKCLFSAAVPTALVVAGTTSPNYWHQHTLLLTPHNEYCSWAWV